MEYSKARASNSKSLDGPEGCGVRTQQQFEDPAPQCTPVTGQGYKAVAHPCFPESQLQPALHASANLNQMDYNAIDYMSAEKEHFN